MPSVKVRVLKSSPVVVRKDEAKAVDSCVSSAVNEYIREQLPDAYSKLTEQIDNDGDNIALLVGSRAIAAHVGGEYDEGDVDLIVISKKPPTEDAKAEDNKKGTVRGAVTAALRGFRTALNDSLDDDGNKRILQDKIDRWIAKAGGANTDGKRYEMACSRGNVSINRSGDKVIRVENIPKMDKCFPTKFSANYTISFMNTNLENSRIDLKSSFDLFRISMRIVRDMSEEEKASVQGRHATKDFHVNFLDVAVPRVDDEKYMIDGKENPAKAFELYSREIDGHEVANADGLKVCPLSRLIRFTTVQILAYVHRAQLQEESFDDEKLVKKGKQLQILLVEYVAKTRKNDKVSMDDVMCDMRRIIQLDSTTSCPPKEDTAAFFDSLFDSATFLALVKAVTNEVNTRVAKSGGGKPKKAAKTSKTTARR